MYGYQENEKNGSVSFGLNTNCKMVKFEYNPNAGKDNTDMPALDIVFNCNGREVNYRQFPITKVFDKNGGEITDKKHPKFTEALVNFNAIITELITCYIPKDEYKILFAKPVSSFKEFCNIIEKALGDSYKEKSIDIFFQYQWSIKGENLVTFLEIPKTLKHGKIFTPSSEEMFSEYIVENFNEKTKIALYYKSDLNVIHPFTRNGWFMNSNFAKQQKIEGDSISENPPTTDELPFAESTDW